ncbi:carbohydrate ABC transporter permease [Ruminiclostridium cellobioparum]|uniref:ABC-type sugar transport system, permease component n=1 Tax=Ruminiclostridium cellobioparum subsp. termitidis CT1112 TaxID=1195236 RepID=S0FHM6_RUMCE|nr:carbohydrate ABC transporter permease [Ruminiclostridium cellobioparum]EMS69421.1 ABC-type sugar transport system, permease component [Ruminiclostridium cellobioparum subsp. termitidis CT1112]
MATKSTSNRIFNFTGYTFIAILSVLSVIPFIMIISSSVTAERSILRYGYSLIPREFSGQAYAKIFGFPDDVFKAYGITIYNTVAGTILGLFLTAMTAYVLSRKHFAWRNKFSFFFYFTTLFSGGIVPWYILCVRFLHFKDMPLIAQVVPYLFSVFNIIIVKSFMQAIPDAITESAKIDGAGDFRIFIQLIFPLSKPVLASIALFIAIGYWNDWYLSFMFVQKSSYFSLQFYLYKILSAAEALNRIQSLSGNYVGEMPKENVKMAMAVIATGPIILLYPFLQKYFVKGLTIGAVKG